MISFDKAENAINRCCDEKATRVLAAFRSIRQERIKEQSRNLRFFYNGIKIPGESKMVKGWFAYGRWQKDNSPYVNFHADAYRTPDAIHYAFVVENNTDSQTDYFEKDSMTIDPLHRYWKDALKAVLVNIERNERNDEKRNAKYAAKGYSTIPVNYRTELKEEIAALIDAPATVALAAGN
jgi:hypothetical protein